MRFRLMILALALLLVPTFAYAQNNNVGKLGVGYTYGNAPVGVRMWFAPNMGFDANFGLSLNGEENDHESPGDTTTTADWALDGGFLLSLFQGQNSILYARFGLNLDRRYAEGFENDGDAVHSDVKTLSLTAMAGVELFLTQLGFPELSLQASVGFGYQHVWPQDQIGDEDSDWGFGTSATALSVVETAQLGFHYYFDI